MKAIIIAAGSAKRLNKETEKLPKGLLSINGKSLLERQINVLKNNKIDEIIIITGPHKEKFRFEDVTYVEDKEYEKHDVLSSLMTAKDKMNGEFITTYSDILFDDEILKKILDSDADIGVATDLNWEKKYENRTEHPKEQADNAIIEDDRIVKIKKNITQISSGQQNGEFIGIIKFSKEGGKKFVDKFERIQKLNPRPFHDAQTFQKAYLTDMLQELINQGMIIEPVLVKGDWFEIDTLQDLKNAREKYV